MKAIIGLGNPGPTYRSTRHNVGWFVLDVLAKRWSAGASVTARHSQVARLVIDGEQVFLVRPQTFMNDSGKAVRALIERDGLGVDEILVIYDDLDLAAGRIRVRPSGSAGDTGASCPSNSTCANLRGPRRASARRRPVWKLR